MSDKQLKDKAIKIKGKEYVMVKDRVQYFLEEYPKGSIKTALLSTTHIDRVDKDSPEGMTDALNFVVCATVETGDGRVFNGHSQATLGEAGGANLTAALENAETSAVGRALAFMGIGVIDSIASGDEMFKAGKGRL